MQALKPAEPLVLSRYSSGQLHLEESSVVFLQQNYDINREKM